MKKTTKIPDHVIDLQAAKSYARACHEMTNHMYGGEPYFYAHIEHVIHYFNKYKWFYVHPKYHDVGEAAAAGHDLVEDCRQTPNDVTKHMNLLAAQIIFAVSNEKGWARDDRANDKYYNDMKAEHLMGLAVMIKLCDRLANVHNSVSKGHGMAARYRSELIHFKEMLYKEGEYELMWQELEDMLSEDEFTSTFYVHKSKGGIYRITERGKAKIAGEWFDTITYYRLPIDLKEGEKTDVPYTRTVADFKFNFSQENASIFTS